MNRELKFRAWDMRTNKMFVCGGLLINHGATAWTFPNTKEIVEPLCPTEDRDLILMQFTGLKDKNGLQEVYEGDILENKSVVRFRNGRFHPVYDGGTAEDEEDDFWLNEREIIGNIYEDPELLK